MRRVKALSDPADIITASGSDCEARSWIGEPRDVATLPRRLDGPSDVVLSDEGDRLRGRYAVQHRKTGKSGTGPAAPAAAGDFDPLVLGSAPRLTQRVVRIVLVGR